MKRLPFIATLVSLMTAVTSDYEARSQSLDVKFEVFSMRLKQGLSALRSGVDLCKKHHPGEHFINLKEYMADLSLFRLVGVQISNEEHAIIHQISALNISLHSQENKSKLLLAIKDIKKNGKNALSRSNWLQIVKDRRLAEMKINIPKKFASQIYTAANIRDRTLCELEASKRVHERYNDLLLPFREFSYGVEDLHRSAVAYTSGVINSVEFGKIQKKMDKEISENFMKKVNLVVSTFNAQREHEIKAANRVIKQLEQEQENQRRRDQIEALRAAADLFRPTIIPTTPGSNSATSPFHSYTINGRTYNCTTISNNTQCQ